MNLSTASVQTLPIDISGILKMLPHRYPFLLVDRVTAYEPCKSLVAVKNVTINEHFFQGHFPDHPVMPGVLIVEAMAQAAATLVPDFVILDGNQDWLSTPEQPALDLFAPAVPAPAVPWRIQTRIKADMTCLSVAAASVLAKVERDGIMAGLAEHFPAFGWQANMGYGTAAHRAAIAELGPTDYHRKSWRLM